MVDHKKTYQCEADMYELLVSREDYEGNLLREILKISPLTDLNVLDLGTGSGRVAQMLRPYVRGVVATDTALPMLDIAKAKFERSGSPNWSVAGADHRAIPIKNKWADVVISGWSICYLADWYPQTWEDELHCAMSEIERVLAAEGCVIIIETQGTGFTTPNPPPHLEKYFQYLEQAGFLHSWIRTDYRFDDLDQAVATTSAFFGSDFGETVKKNGWVVVPECTGLWWKVKPIHQTRVI